MWYFINCECKEDLDFLINYLGPDFTCEKYEHDVSGDLWISMDQVEDAKEKLSQLAAHDIIINNVRGKIKYIGSAGQKNEQLQVLIATGSWSSNSNNQCLSIIRDSNTEKNCAYTDIENVLNRETYTYLCWVLISQYFEIDSVNKELFSFIKGLPMGINIFCDVKDENLCAIEGGMKPSPESVDVPVIIDLDLLEEAASLFTSEDDKIRTYLIELVKQMYQALKKYIIPDNGFGQLLFGFDPIHCTVEELKKLLEAIAGYWCRRTARFNIYLETKNPSIDAIQRIINCIQSIPADLASFNIYYASPLQSLDLATSGGTIWPKKIWEKGEAARITLCPPTEVLSTLIYLLDQNHMI